MKNFGIAAEAVEAICLVFDRYPAIEAATLYGSRAKGDYKPGSDIDLCLHGSQITTKMVAAIADDLDELLLPYTIDLSVFEMLEHAELKAHIERVGQVFYRKRSI